MPSDAAMDDVLHACRLKHDVDRSTDDVFAEGKDVLEVGNHVAAVYARRARLRRSFLDLETTAKLSETLATVAVVPSKTLLQPTQHTQSQPQHDIAHVRSCTPDSCDNGVHGTVAPLIQRVGRTEPLECLRGRNI